MNDDMKAINDLMQRSFDEIVRASMVPAELLGSASNASQEAVTLTYDTLMQAKKMLEALPEPEPIYLVGQPMDTDKVIAYYRREFKDYWHPFTVKNSRFASAGLAFILCGGKLLKIETALL